MTFDLTSLSKFIPSNSVISNGEGDDQLKPFSYTEWLNQSSVSTSVVRDYTVEYNKYIKSWNQYVQEKKTPYNRQERYKLLIKNIALNYTTDEEKRFLTNIDYENQRHVAAATTFFAEKIKEIALYYADARQNIRQANTRSGATGSKYTIEKLVYNEIPKLVNERNILGDQRVDKNSGYTGGKSVVKVIDLFEIEEDQLQATQIEYDKELYIDIQQAVQNLLNECLPVLQISDGLSLTVSNAEINDTNISLLDYENFESYIKRESELNLHNLSKTVPKLVGADMYTLSGGQPVKLFEGEYKWRNIFNRTGPQYNTQYTNKLKSKQQIGNLFIPQNMGVLTYYSHKPTLQSIPAELEGQIIPDPYKMNTTGMLKHAENVEWVKASTANDGLAGDIVDANKLARFYSYRSREDSTLNSGYGLSRTYDPIGFFTGDKNDVWANSDVFEKEAANIYDIDHRQETLLTGHNTVTSWISDIYGNQYSLYKPAPPRSPTTFIFGESEEDYLTSSVCKILDGGDTLKKRPKLWDEGVEYKIYEGGRRWDVDPKVEQQINITPFEDLRQMIRVKRDDGTVVEVLEEHNAYDYQPNNDRTELQIRKITYHGFKKKGLEPVYDEQAYGGLFTDLTCGQIDPASRKCIIRDNYAFGTFSDIVSGDYYISREDPLPGFTDAFESYTNTDYDDILTFNDELKVSGVELFVGENMDGAKFGGDDCFDNIEAQFTYEIENSSTFFDKSINVGRTKLAQINYVDESEQTQYNRSREVGTIYFRSYNDSRILKIQDILAELATETGDSVGSDRVKLIEQINNGQVINMDVFYDVLYIETETFMYIERIKFDYETSSLLKSDYPSVLIRKSTDDDQLISPIYNKEKHELLYGQTFMHVVNEKTQVYPVIYRTNLTNMSTDLIFTDTDNNIEQYTLSDNLSSFQIEKIDKPILSYNELIDLYSLTFSCKLSSANHICYGICIGDFDRTDAEYSMKDLQMNHTTPVTPTNVYRAPWEEKKLSKNIKFNPSELPVPVDNDVNYTLSLSSIMQEVFNGYQLELTFDTKTIPVSNEGAKINQIIFNPDDGSENKQVTRLIETGFEPINFDIGDLPDQSDLHDPRKYGITHQYIFADSSRDLYTPTLTAVYANHRKLIVEMRLEVEPYTIETGFDDIRVIDTKTYTDQTGHNKQLIVTETVNPRYVSHNVITKSIYTNSDVIGLVDGEQYRGDYHKMSDGTIMTGNFHYPGSKVITQIT